jgi:cytochrome P450
LSVFKETLRLWPVAPQLIRRIRQSMTIDGYVVPENSLVFVSHTFVMPVFFLI